MARIAILVPTLKKGGAEKQAALLARGLSECHDVYVIIPFPSSGLERENIELCGLPEDKIIRFEGKDEGSKSRLLHELKTISPDILFCYLTWPDFWGPIVGRMAGVKYIYQGLRNAKLPRLKLLLEKIGNKFSTGAITNNYVGAEEFKKFGIKNQVVIPNCYPNPQEFNKRGNKDKIEVITVGRFVVQKDYPTLINAMKVAMSKKSDLKLTIIGHGELESEVRQLVKDSGIATNTKILINPTGILGYLQQADIYLSTSLFEGTSNSIMEALDASLPVVATDVGDNNQLVKEGYNGYLTEIEDVEAISDKILELASSLDKRNEMGRKGNELLKREFGVQKFLNSYQNLISNLKDIKL